MNMNMNLYQMKNFPVSLQWLFTEAVDYLHVVLFPKEKIIKLFIL